MSRVEPSNRATVLRPNDLQTLGWPRRKNKPTAVDTVRGAPEQETDEMDDDTLKRHWEKQGVRDGLPFCFPVVPPTFDWETYRRINFSTDEEREAIDRPEKAWLHWLRVGRHGKAFACNNSAANKQESSGGASSLGATTLGACCPGASEVTFAALALVARVMANDRQDEALDKLTHLQKLNPALDANQVVATYLNACGYAVVE